MLNLAGSATRFDLRDLSYRDISSGAKRPIHISRVANPDPVFCFDSNPVFKFLLIWIRIRFQISVDPDPDPRHKSVKKVF